MLMPWQVPVVGGPRGAHAPLLPFSHVHLAAAAHAVEAKAAGQLGVSFATVKPLQMTVAQVAPPVVPGGR